jgi:TPR repeat protein
MRKLLVIFMPLVFGFSMQVSAQNLAAVQIYKDDQLLDLIKENKHLSQVVIDECQLVQDIKDRAVKAERPSYQFLWGDMLAYGVCIKKDIPLGLHYMQLAADQGLPEALEQLGRYYHIGRFVQQDLTQALHYLKAAAALNNLKAQIRLAKIYNDGLGSPLDYPIVYSQLHHAIISDKKTHKEVKTLLAKLSDKIPQRIVEQAKISLY